jgi:hypothetical protein
VITKGFPLDALPAKILSGKLMPLKLMQQRQQTQGLLQPIFNTPLEFVSALGGVQAQDYPAAKWAIGQRLPWATDASLDDSYNTGEILRTHVLRPTWQFVTPADIRWMLALTAPRIHALNAYYYRKMELDEAVFAQTHEVMTRELQGNRYLTRTEIMQILEKIGIRANELRSSYIMMHAELEGLVCSGPRKGKQFTYALLEERVPPAPSLTREEALTELAKRYFEGHGPAMLQDFVWWSGLTVADARSGLEAAKSHLVHETIDDKTYWWSPSAPVIASPKRTPTVYLLPNYDELLLSYQDRSEVEGVEEYMKRMERDSILFSHTIVIDTRVAGTWKRSFQKGVVNIVASTFHPLTSDEHEAFAAAADRYAAFLGMKAVFTFAENG